MVCIIFLSYDLSAHYSIATLAFYLKIVIIQGDDNYGVWREEDMVLCMCDVRSAVE
ncbi:hypothetical protein [Helicobacter equorum]|uniref:hypothetical protein n=1 Tax=Helicobacter equorum TaxID=361872 RepID=UPI0013152E7A|nr:hypothetical protein [Helicobacter equorum]